MRNAFLTSVFLFFVLTSSVAQVAEKAEDISPLLISEKVPAVSITSLSGKTAVLTDIVIEKRSILLFYRGGWCPYCNAHLSAVGEIEKEIINLGYQVIAISPDSPENLKVTMGKDELNYELYSDGSGSLMKAMGLAFKAPENYNKRLSNYSNSQNPGLLPVPSLFILNTEGTILFEYISPDYKHRISTDLLLEVLKQLNKEIK
jgi:peroxiredoxin